MTVPNLKNLADNCRRVSERQDASAYQQEVFRGYARFYAELADRDAKKHADRRAALGWTTRRKPE